MKFYEGVEPPPPLRLTCLKKPSPYRVKSTQDIDKYADFIITAVSTAVDKAIPTSKSGRPDSQPISEETR